MTAANGLPTSGNCCWQFLPYQLLSLIPWAQAAFSISFLGSAPVVFSSFCQHFLSRLEMVLLRCQSDFGWQFLPYLFCLGSVHGLKCCVLFLQVCICFPSKMLLCCYLWKLLLSISLWLWATIPVTISCNTDEPAAVLKLMVLALQCFFTSFLSLFLSVCFFYKVSTFFCWNWKSMLFQERIYNETMEFGTY